MEGWVCRPEKQQRAAEQSTTAAEQCKRNAQPQQPQRTWMAAGREPSGTGTTTSMSQF